jgi:hypothetical protein
MQRNSQEPTAMRLSTRFSIALMAASATVLPSAARAQELSEPPATVTARETTSQTTGPSLWMIGSGLTLFGFAYVPVVVVGATSGLNADRALFVPIAGPWIDLAQRPACTPVSTCDAESSAKVLLVVDGVFQAIGALTVLGAFLNPTHETTTVRSTASARPKVHVSPAQIGPTGYGMVALGTF